MDRKEIAKQTLEILQKGYYFYGDKKIDIAKQHRKSVEKSLLITPEYKCYMNQDEIKRKDRVSPLGK